MLEALKKFSREFLEKTEKKHIFVISHYDTDGISSAAIISKALQRLDKEFSIKIIKQLEKETIESLPQDKVLIFLDSGSGSLDYLKNLNTEIFILDHHELDLKGKNLPENIHIINPHLFDGQEISGSSLTYLFAKQLSEENKDLANLALFGMVGDLLDKNIGKLNNSIINDSEVKIKKGLLLYPATRPLNKVLEFSSDIYIPGVTGYSRGAYNLLREVGIEKIGSQYKSILELNEEEMSKLITAIMLRTMNHYNGNFLVGNIYLVNFFNKLEDVREISAMVNACGRLGEPGTAIAFCLEDKKAKEKAETIYTKYKQEIIKALNDLPTLKKIEGKDYLIINAEDKIKDTIIGTIATISSSSNSHEEGKAIIAMAYNKEKIKVSARIVGKNGKNMCEILSSVVKAIGGEYGGHKNAAGCLIEKEKEAEFISLLQKKLEYEVVKI